MWSNCYAFIFSSFLLQLNNMCVAVLLPMAAVQWFGINDHINRANVTERNR